ncbi:hypothetical protein [Dactylosporangium sp. NPDC048998]|uniref:hypothetical protein n=1 Tax=Dactylosporangium sp. NPDC048998 TaxID=3363976 RepID=UPI00371C47CD
MPRHGEVGMSSPEPEEPPTPPPQWHPWQPLAWAPPSRPATASPSAPPGRRWPVVAGVALAVAAAIVIGVGAYLVPGGAPQGKETGESGADPTRKLAYELLVEAAGNLRAAPAQHYGGTVTTPGGQQVRVDGQVTVDGITVATVDIGGGRGELLDLGDDGTFARGDAAFWSAARTPGSAEAYGDSWVRIDFDALGFDLRALIPQVLAADLLPGGGDDEAEPAATDLPRLGDAGTIGGVEARQVHTGDATVWISTAAPARIVRVESAGADPSAPAASDSAAPPVGPSLRSSRHDNGGGAAFVLARAPSDTLALDFAPLSRAKTGELLQAVQRRVAGLVDALDPQVGFVIDGQIKVGPCGQTSCLAVVTVSNTVTARSPYVHPVRQANAAVTIDLTLDGRPLKTCTELVSMPVGGQATARCSATYTLPVATVGHNYYIEARATASSRALVQADVQRIIDRLGPATTSGPGASPTRTNGQGAGPTATSGAGASPAWSGEAGAPRCLEPTGADGGPGQWRPLDRAAARDRVTYQEQVTGVRHGREYRVGDRDFDGYRSEGDTHVLVEAEGGGNAWLLWGVRVGDGGTLTYVDDEGASEAAMRWGERARARLDGLMRELRGRLDQLRTVPGARLRFVAAEPEVLDKFRAYARTQLTPEDLARVEWRHAPVDGGFAGCG